MNTKLLRRIQTCCPISALGLATFILFAETGRAVLPEGRSVDIEAQRAGVSLSWLSITNAPYAVQGRTNLMQGLWGSLDTIIGAGGTSVYPVVFTDSPSRFFRVLFPQPSVQAGEPAFVQSAGGSTLFISGQFFYAGDLIRVGGVLLSNVTFLSSTLLSGTLPPQAPGLYDIEVLSGQSGAVLAVLHDAVQVSPPFYQTVQEPPEWPPAGPSPAFGKEFKGHVSLLKAFDDEPPPPAAQTHTKSGHVSLLKAFDDGSSSALIAAFLSKKGYDYYQSQSSLNAARSHTKTGHVTLLKAFDDDPPNAARKDFKGHVTLLKAFDDEPPPAAAKTHTKTGHVTLMKAFDDDAGDAITGKKDFKGHVTLMKAYDDTAPELRIHSGELQHQVPDLAVAGRGLDFVWMRTYRSLTGTNTTQGARWTHSYDVRCVHNGEGLDIYDGTGRRDTFRLQADGTYACPGFFREGTFTGGVFRLTFADSGFWAFYPLDSSPAAGKLSRIEDRNGNALTLSYDGSGRLVQVTDTLGRGHVLQYTPAGRIASVTDCTGRTVTYSYYAGEPGGSVGDLKSVTSPPVTGTPNGNDFPTGKTITYTYTSGNSDERMNHLMLTVRDALGQLATQCTYDLNPASATFLRANTTSCGSNPPTVCTYIALTPSPDNRFAAMRCIVNDPVGNVTESFFDLRNRCVTQRELTGRAVAGLPVTASDNRPTGKLRNGDPDLYETQLSWNNDSLCTRIALPSGLVGKFLHAGDQGILIRCRKRPDLLTAEWDSTLADDIGADTDGDGIMDLTKVACHYTYDPRFSADPSDLNLRTRINELESRLKGLGLLTRASGGNTPIVRGSALGTLSSRTKYKGWDGTIKGVRFDGRDDDCDGFVTSATDPRDIVSTAEYDEHGNLIYYQPESSNPKVGIGVATPSAFFAYDTYGQLIAITNAPDATGRRCVTTQGWLTGHLHDRVVDAAPGGLHLTTTFERDARGNVTRCIDPKGNDTRSTYNALDQMVSCSSAPYGDGSGQRITTTVAYDANDNVVQIDTDNRRDTGAPVLDNPAWTTRFGYDGLSRCVSVAAEVDASTSVTNRFEHDANGQLTALLSPPAADGTEPFNRTAFTYDERGLLFRMIEAPGSSVSATTEYSYTKDFNPATKKYVDDTVAVFDYDGLDRVKSVTDALGNTETYCFDAPGNLTVCRSLGETADLPGSTSNRRLSESRWTYDGLDRCVERIDSFFDIFTELPIDDGTRSTHFAYSPDGRCTSITNDAGHACSYTYDTAGRLASVTGPRGDTRVCVRDANGNVTRVTATDFSDVSSGAQIFVGDYSYDGMDRRIRASDNVGNTNCWFYDSQSCLARYTDPRGNETRYRYDGRPRRTATLSYIGPCDADADGVDRGITISTSHVAYDTAGRVIAETDANTNTTVYAYDVRDRLVAVTNADGTVQRLVWSPRSNLTREEDANGTAIDYSYDPLNRLIRKQISAGFMVEPTTTFESFAYDGLSRLVAASNDLSQTAFTYDSLGNTASSVQDGRSATPATASATAAPAPAPAATWSTQPMMR